MTVRKKGATVKRVAKASKVKLAKTATHKAAVNTESRAAFAANLVPRGVDLNAPAGAMMILAKGQPAQPGARNITMLNRSSPAPTAAAAATSARAKAKGTTKT